METKIKTIRLKEDVYLFTSDNASFYLVLGEKTAAVIDTGITPGEKILPLMRELTPLPLILVVTHAHLDHMYHIDEFDTVYLCHDELALPKERLPFMTGGKQDYLPGTLDIQTGDVIDLGGDSLEICKVPGHTPGSVVILEKKHDMLFTGDAIESGFGVFMQIPGATDLETYRASLQQLLRWCSQRGGLMSFWGGHAYQQFESKQVPQYNPLSLGLAADLLTLTDKLIRGEIVGRMSGTQGTNLEEIPLYAAYGRAEIEYLASRIRKA